MKTLQGTLLIGTISLNDKLRIDDDDDVDWVLSGGYWNDALLWSDGENWID